ncbi:hypothetical protein DNTS_032849 [Danionella cerebrum]|uniref:Uncharacterized protein n=1 Tax=Danionella cerebrum TaxID=2873325 RepID=A0A553RLE0_9TELE|nr:hypothetical protein DNTS_032849 [Danionella translucida]
MFKHLKPIMCVKINEALVVSSCAGGQVRVWSMETASLIRQISGHQGAVLCLCVDQWHILSGGSDGVVKAWSTNCSFKKCLKSFEHPKEVLTMAFLFLRIITGCMDGRIRIFNFLNGDCLRVIKTNMKQCPVLSLHTHHNTVVVNTRERIQMLQFAEVQWDYSASAHRNICEQFNVSSVNVAQNSDQVIHRRSSSPKRPFLHLKSLSAASLQHSQGSQRDSTRPATWCQAQSHNHNRASVKMQTQGLNRLQTGPSAGHPVSIQKRAIFSRSTTLSPDETSDSKRSTLTQSEKAVKERVRKRGPHHPPTANLILLKAGSSPMSCYSDQARSNMELNARVRDAWGPQTCPSEAHAPYSTLNTQRFTPHSFHNEVRPSYKSSPLQSVFPEDAKTARLFMKRISFPNHLHKDSETSKAISPHVSLDPFKKHRDFQLKTDTQQETFIQEGTQQHW